MVQITEKQHDVLRFIEKYTERELQSPSYREIQEHFGFESPNAVRKYLDILSKRGYITINRSKTGRCRSFFPCTKRDTTVPVLGAIAAGNPIEAIERCDTRIDVSGIGIDNSDGDYFALTVRGTSMIEAHIMDGDMVIIKRQPEVRNGEIAAVLWNNEATLKYVKVSSDGSIRLVPANREMEPMAVIPEKTASFQIIGKLVRVVRSY
jgi:repressor LexA